MLRQGGGKFLPSAFDAVLAHTPRRRPGFAALNLANRLQHHWLEAAASRTWTEIALARGQSLAQMATAWVLRDKRVTSALIGASKPEQIVDLVGAMQNLSFTQAELDAIDGHAVDGGINLWKRPSTDQRLA